MIHPDIKAQLKDIGDNKVEGDCIHCGKHFFHRRGNKYPNGIGNDPILPDLDDIVCSWCYNISTFDFNKMIQYKKEIQ